MSSVISFKLQRSLFKNSPLAEKTRSVSTDVGGANESADQICFTLFVSSRFDMKRLISFASVSVLGLVGSVSLFSKLNSYFLQYYHPMSVVGSDCYLRLSTNHYLCQEDFFFFNQANMFTNFCLLSLEKVCMIVFSVLGHR